MSPAVLGGADLTLTMGEIQRDAALALNPRGLRSTFTVREAAALLTSLPPVVAPMAPEADRHGRAVVAHMAAARRFRAVPEGADDLPDLLDGDVRLVQPMVDQLSRDVAALLRACALPEFGTAADPVPTAMTSSVPAVA